MQPNGVSSIDRRDFPKLASAATTCGLSQHALAAGSERFSLIVEPGNVAASSGPVTRAAGQLRQALAAKEVACEVASSADAAAGSSFSIVVAAPGSNLAQGFPTGAALAARDNLCMSPGKAGRTPALLLSASDVRGYVYGLLELADRVRYGSNPAESLRLAQVVEEKPATEGRSGSRYFCSELDD